MQVIDDALAAGARVACLSETLSAPSDDVAGSLWKLLGSQRAQQLRLVSAALHDGEREVGEDGMSWEQSLSEASARAKQQAAEVGHDLFGKADVLCARSLGVGKGSMRVGLKCSVDWNRFMLKLGTEQINNLHHWTARHMLGV